MYLPLIVMLTHVLQQAYEMAAKNKFHIIRYPFKNHNIHSCAMISCNRPIHSNSYNIIF